MHSWTWSSRVLNSKNSEAQTGQEYVSLLYGFDDVPVVVLLVFGVVLSLENMNLLGDVLSGILERLLKQNVPVKSNLAKIYLSLNYLACASSINCWFLRWSNFRSDKISSRSFAKSWRDWRSISKSFRYTSN